MDHDTLNYVDNHRGGMTTTEKLIFIASFMWMMQWGTRVTTVTLNALS